jgi:hypothetical protein
MGGDKEMTKEVTIEQFTPGEGLRVAGRIVYRFPIVMMTVAAIFE